MKYIKFYIVTYNQPEQLKITYYTLSKSLVNESNCEINIINNHSNFIFDGQVDNIYHNTLRPDNSYGYLARNWNQSILNGFKNTKKPDTEWVGLVQSDVIFDENWLEWFKNEKNIDFYQWGPGDQFILMNLEAFKQIGWFDERFTSLAMQEYDYCLRAYLNLKNRCALQGHYGIRAIYNPPTYDAIVREEEHRVGHSTEAHHQQRRWFEHKWSPNVYNIMRAPLGTEWVNSINRLKLHPPREINWYPYMYEGDETYNNIYL